MPSAGSFSDGTFSFTSSKFGPTLRNVLSFQALPNVFGAFRYTGIGDKKYYYHESGYTSWDRSFDLRIDLLKEKKLIPSVTMGYQDVIGTGNYSAEYIVASKSLKNFRATAGIGWGRLSTQNQIVKNKSRPRSGGGSFGGLLRFPSMYKGNIGLFGGIEYNTPINGLIAKAEISSDSYEMDGMYILESTLSNISKLNYGLSYTLSPNFNASSYLMQGNKVGLNLNLSLNPNSTYVGDYFVPAPQPFYSIPYPEKNNMETLWKNIISTLKDEDKIETIGFKTTSNEAIIFIENNYYVSDTQAIGRTLRIMSRFIPMTISKFTVVINKLNIPISQITIDRNKIAEIVDAPNAELITKKIALIENSSKTYEDVNISNQKRLKRGEFYISPFYQIHLFDPDRPLYYQLGASIGGSYLLKPGLTLSGSIKEPMISTFNDIKRGEKGKLPKVRTKLKNYLNVQDTRINDLTLSSYYKLNKNLYGRFSVGYFESMYAGISSELLLFRETIPFSLGAEINYVKPREFRQLFGLREIDNMANLNGHITTYWDTNFYDYQAKLDYGKYLAGDKGSTFTLTRSFRNGWDFGGFFTLTDAKFSEFGEGSFDKGFFFKIPLNAVVPFETKTSFVEKIRPIQGDGGAKVEMAGRIYELVAPKRKSFISQSWSKLWR